MTHTVPHHPPDVCVVFKDGEYVATYANPQCSSSRAVPLAVSMKGVVNMGMNTVRPAGAEVVSVPMVVNKEAHISKKARTKAATRGCVPVASVGPTRSGEGLPPNCHLADIVCRKDMLSRGHLVVQVIEFGWLCLLYGGCALSGSGCCG